MKVKVLRELCQQSDLERWTVESCPESPGGAYLPRRIFLREGPIPPRTVTFDAANCDSRFTSAAEELSDEATANLMIHHPEFFCVVEREAIRLKIDDEGQLASLDRAHGFLVLLPPKEA